MEVNRRWKAAAAIAAALLAAALGAWRLVPANAGRPAAAALPATIAVPVLDQSLLLALSAQTRWAMAKGLVKAGPAPSHLEFVRPEPLNAVAPDANRMID